jgi:hypothetical protein
MARCILCGYSFPQLMDEEICPECTDDLDRDFSIIHPNETEEEFWDHEDLINED